MEILEQQPPEIRALWPRVPASLRLDVLAILRSNLSDSPEMMTEKLAAVQHAVDSPTQEAFVPHNPLLRKQRDIAVAASQALLYKPEPSPYGMPCKYCKSLSTRAIPKQLSSADEPMNLIVMCDACNKSSKM